jgi:multidrug efflux pump subunit AcrA (membrane-fusion protein)
MIHRTVALVTAALVLAGCSREEPPKNATPVQRAEAPAGETREPLLRLSSVERETLGVVTVKAAMQPINEVRRFPGVIKAHPDRVAIVTSRTTGKLVAFRAAVGDRVARGQAVAEVQSLEVERLGIELIQAEHRYEAERAKLELGLSQAENKLHLVQAEAERHRTLVAKGIAAGKELIAAENQLRAVGNETAGLRRQLDLLAQAHRNELAGFSRQLTMLGLSLDAIGRLRDDPQASLLKISTLLGGIIVERPAALGQVIDPTSPLFKIQDDSMMIVEGDAFEDALPMLRVGQAVRVTVAAHPGRVFQGRVTFIAPTVDPEKRVARLWVEMANADGRLKQDMFAELAVSVGSGRPVVTIPAAAIVTAEGQEFAILERADGFARTPIVPGARSDDVVEVKRGVIAGDTVVTTGKHELYAQLRAKPTGQTTGSAPRD